MLDILNDWICRPFEGPQEATAKKSKNKKPSKKSKKDLAIAEAEGDDITERTLLALKVLGMLLVCVFLPLYTL